MTINHLLAVVVPVSDFDRANTWYQKLFGRAAAVIDPDGNTITLIGGFRVVY